MTVHEQASSVADRLETELRALGRWSTIALDPARLADMGAFGMNTLVPEEWIQFVLLPRIREMVAAGAALPKESATAVWATRQFDGDPDAAGLVDLLRELDDLANDPNDSALVIAVARDDRAAIEALIESGSPITPRVLIAAVTAGRIEVVRLLLDEDADPDELDGRGISPLHVAAAGGSALLPALLSTPYEIDLANLANVDEPGESAFAAIATALLDAQGDPDLRAEPAGLTPLMIATCFGRRDVAAVLLARGATVDLRDTLGRTAERFAVFPMIARVIRLCQRLPMVKTAHVAQIHAPVTHQFTSPVLGLELTAALPADGFASWPADEPLVAFVLGDDAMSRLVRLTPPVYVAPAPTSIRGIAEAIARELEAGLREVPSGDHTAQLAIVLPDGRVPILVRDFGHAFGVEVSGSRTWRLLASADTTAIVPDVAAVARQWNTNHPTTVTLLEIALDLVTALGGELGERWTVAIPGTEDPTEVWLHAPIRESGAVGVFRGRALVWVEGEARSIDIRSRADLVAARAHVITNVREQQRLYSRNVQLGERLVSLAGELASRLAVRIPIEGGWQYQTRGTASYDTSITITIGSSDGSVPEAVTLAAVRGELRAHAGLVGDDGWDGELATPEAIDAALDAIVAAVERARHSLTIEQLAVGTRYRVLQDHRELVAGSAVRYARFDDVDNHYHRYVFTTEDGNEVVVDGDASTPRTGPLGEVHRFLEQLPD
ncbi:MAG: YqcC family protein [Deltaproteobacteria bacterium]|nr:YqcC family protein [Deltaproteobacteria bacterium]